MKFEKQFVERDLSGYRSPYEDPFFYRSLSDLEPSLFERVVKKAVQGSLSRDDQKATQQSVLNELIELAGPAFDREWWLISFLKDKPCGFVLPQAHPADSQLGTIFHLGVLSEYRGKRYGQILHARGLEELANRGVKNYMGSTDVQNRPMLDIFRENGCTFIETRIVEL